MTLGGKRKVRCGMRVLEWVDDQGVSASCPILTPKVQFFLEMNILL